jgi:hypothetical protein
MTRLAPLWQQNATYPAQTDRVLVATLWPTSSSVGGAVTTVSNTMNVSVAPGTAAVSLGASGVNYSALCRWDAAETVTLATAPPSGQSRISLIVAQVRDAALDAGANNDFIFQEVAGTATTGTPVAPAVPANAYAIAQLTIPGGSANLNGVTVVDLRATLVTAPELPSPLAATAALATYTDPAGDVWVAKGGVNAGAWRRARDVLQARVYRAAAWTLTNNGQIPFDTAVFDNYGLFVANAFTVPVAGTYLAYGGMSANATAAGQTVGMYIQRNGTTSVQASTLSAASGFVFPNGGDIFPCVAGDVLRVTGALGGPASLAGTTGLGNTYFWTKYLSP